MTNAELTPTKHRVVSIPWKPGQSGNPAGRPRGSRGKLSEDFLSDLHNSWIEHGVDALTACAKTEPGVYCRIIANLLPRSLDVNVSGSVDIGEFATRFRRAVELLHEASPMMRTIEHKATTGDR